MARPLRLEYEGAIYHVTVRGNDRKNIFLDDKDRKYLLSRLSDCVELCGVRLYLFCLMSNHFHLVLETPHANLSRFMQKVLTGFTVYFNCRHKRIGHVTQGRYHARLVQGDEYLLKLSRYVHLNPIKARKMTALSNRQKVEHLRKYTWSSYRSYIGKAKDYPFVEYAPMLSLAGGKGKKHQKQQYRAFVEQMIDKEDEAFIGELKKCPRSIGAQKYREWVNDCFAGIIGKKKRKEDVSFRNVRAKVLEKDVILEIVAKECKIDKLQLYVRSRESIYRGIAGLMLCKHAGCNQRQVAEVLGLKTGAAVSYQIAQVEKRAGVEVDLKSSLCRIDKKLEVKKLKL